MDRGYSWVICGVAFFNNFFLMLGLSTFGILLPEFMDHFSTSNADAALIGSLNSAVGAISGLVLNPVVMQIGCRSVAIAGSLIGAAGYAVCFFAQSILHLCIGFGVISGFANGMVFFSSTVILHHYFNQRRTVAAAISTCGISASMLVMPPFVRWIVSCLGWRTTMLVISAIFLHSAVGGALLRPIDHSNQKLIATDKDSGEANDSPAPARCFRSVLRGASCWAKSIWASFDVSILRNPRFSIFLIGSCITVFGYITPLVFIPTLAHVTLGMSPANSAFLLSLTAVTTIVGRVVSGFLGDRLSFFKRPGRRVYLYSVPNIFSGLCSAAVYIINSKAAFLIYCLIFGFLSGSYIASQQSVMVDLFGLEDFSKILALLLLINGISSFLCQPFAGWLTDISGSSRLAFLANGLIQVVAGLLLLVLIVLGPTKSKTTQQNSKVADTKPVNTAKVDSNFTSNSDDTSFRT